MAFFCFYEKYEKLLILRDIVQVVHSGSNLLDSCYNLTRKGGRVYVV